LEEIEKISHSLGNIQSEACHFVYHTLEFTEIRFVQGGSRRRNEYSYSHLKNLSTGLKITFNVYNAMAYHHVGKGDVFERPVEPTISEVE
jgi:hypothetical protein